MLGGCVGFLLLIAPAITSVPAVEVQMEPAHWRNWQRAAYVALGLTALHIGVLGWQGWFAPSGWPGGMPPITLLSFAAALAPLIRKVARMTGAMD
jgi:DMSO/TMAO reductase YedYZ heme-binding membrane subunit